MLIKKKQKTLLVSILSLTNYKQKTCLSRFETQKQLRPPSSRQTQQNSRADGNDNELNCLAKPELVCENRGSPASSANERLACQGYRGGNDNSHRPTPPLILDSSQKC